MTDGDITISPGQKDMLKRLCLLRQLQKQQINLMGLSENDSSTQSDSDTLVDIKTLLSQLHADSTSYNTFQQVLQESSASPLRASISGTNRDNSPSQRESFSKKPEPKELIEGVSLLNISQESEPKPTTTRSSVHTSRSEYEDRPKPNNSLDKSAGSAKLSTEIPSDNINGKKITKRPFLKRGTGLARYGMTQKSISLPKAKQNNKNTKVKTKAITDDDKHTNIYLSNESLINVPPCQLNTKYNTFSQKIPSIQSDATELGTSDHSQYSCSHQESPGTSHTSESKPRETWASVLTQEQDCYLRQLKQSSYYKNFDSPGKCSSASRNESFISIMNNKEIAEQNMFEFLEKKLTNSSFCSESSFFVNLFRKNKDLSGDSTPKITQQILNSNPHLLNLSPNPRKQIRRQEIFFETGSVNETEELESCNNDGHYSGGSKTDNSTTLRDETCEEETTDTGHRCNQHTGDSDTLEHQASNMNKSGDSKLEEQKIDQEGVTTMAEMNAKLIATGELLKERLHELEDEIDTFRKENESITVKREELEQERQKFLEEKAIFETKFNEEKILAEYFLVEEKEKLAKQKLMYEKYLKDLKINRAKKDSSEIVKLKQELKDVQELLKNKEQKYASSIARLRNQIKTIEKENGTLKAESVKLKKDIRRIQQANVTTRRLTNIKHLAQINNKLSAIEFDHDIPETVIKYEHQDSRKSQKIAPRARTKSVPNLTVTSTYAKYFSKSNVDNKSPNRKYSVSPEISALSLDLDDSCDMISDNMSDGSKNNKIDVSLNYYEDDKCNAQQNTKTELSSKDMVSKEPYVTRHNFSGQSLRKNRSDNSSKDKTADELPLSYQESVKETKSSWLEAQHKNIRDTDNGHSTVKLPYFISEQNNMNNKNIESIYMETFAKLGSSHDSPNQPSILSNLSEKLSFEHDAIYRNDSPKDIGVSMKTSLNLTERRNPDGSKEILFPNGNKKVISEDGDYVKFFYYNGDVKETFFKEGKIKYFYKDSETYHTTFKNGLEILQFSDGQVEKRFKDGSMEIHLPNGSIRYSNPKDEFVLEEWHFPDGTHITSYQNGEQRMKFPNGQVEIHTKDHKRREFPDGTVKLIYADGTTETRFATGRIRIKDKNGQLVMDSHVTKRM